jgi:hypothetical protein
MRLTVNVIVLPGVPANPVCVNWIDPGINESETAAFTADTSPRTWLIEFALSAEVLIKASATPQGRATPSPFDVAQVMLGFENLKICCVLVWKYAMMSRKLLLSAAPPHWGSPVQLPGMVGSHESVPDLQNAYP